MNKKRIQLILYPILAGSISEKQIEKLKEFYKTLSDETVTDLVQNRISPEEVKTFSSDYSVKVKDNILSRSKEIAAADPENQVGEEAFAEFAGLLGIIEKPAAQKDKEPEQIETPVEENENQPVPDQKEPDITDVEAEYRKVLINFSTITSVIAFLPLPVVDLFLIAPIQTAMVAKIVKLYDYDIEPKKLQKALLGALGSAIAIKCLASLAGFLLPLAWIIHASITFAGTYALGILAKEYAEADGDLSKENIKKIWKAALQDGKEEFKKLKEYIVKNKDPLIEKCKQMIKNIKEKQDGKK